MVTERLVPSVLLLKDGLEGRMWEREKVSGLFRSVEGDDGVKYCPI